MSKPIFRSRCRQCGAAVSKYSSACPLCGISYPVYDSLSKSDKDLLDNPSDISPKFYYMLNSIDAGKKYTYNLSKEFKYYLKSPGLSLTLIICIVGAIASAHMMSAAAVGNLVYTVLLIFCLFYPVYDLYTFFNSLNKAYRIRRINMKAGSSPYSLHFKTELQLEKHLIGLSKILEAFFENPPVLSDEIGCKAAEGALTAIKSLTSKIKKCAAVSLKTTLIIWKNNIYSLAANLGRNQEERKESVNIKIREGEALILRYCWLSHLETIPASLFRFFSAPHTRESLHEFKYQVIEANKLSSTGPIFDKLNCGFGTIPLELPFKMRYHMLSQLPPSNLPSEGITETYPETKPFFEAIAKARVLKSNLALQQAVDETADLMSNIEFDNGVYGMEAEDVEQNDLFSDFLDFDSFSVDTEELTNQTNRLNVNKRFQ